MNDFESKTASEINAAINGTETTLGTKKLIRNSSYKTKMIAVCAMLLAIGAVLDAYLNIRMPFFGSGELQIKFVFIVFAIAGMLYGPFVGLWFGFALDTVSCIFQGGFAQGWSWEWMMVNVAKGFLFGLLLYTANFAATDKKIPLWKIITVKTIDTVVLNIGLNSYLTFFVSKWVPFSWEVFGVRVLKNAALLPVEIVILYFVIRFCEKNRKLLK